MNAVVHGKCDGCHKQSELKANTPVCKMVDNRRLTVDQKVKVVLFYAETESVVVTQRRFLAHFGTRWAPCKQTIYRLCQQFETNGSVLEKKQPRPASVCTPANIKAVRMALTCLIQEIKTHVCSVWMGLAQQKPTLLISWDFVSKPREPLRCLQVYGHWRDAAASSPTQNH